MTCCEPVEIRSANRYGPTPATVHAPECEYAPGLPYRGDLTPEPDRQVELPTVHVNEAIAHWLSAPVGHDCDRCRYVDAHLDDEDDERASIADTYDDTPVAT